VAVGKDTGEDFNGIFDGLNDGSYDAVISGTTITPKRERVALYLVVNASHNPKIEAVDALYRKWFGKP
jgi:hypothetical protein